MSWSGHATVGLLVPDWEKAIDDMECSGQDDLLEAEYQIAIAKTLARYLVAECVVSHVGKNVSVSLSGHANPGHGEPARYASEYVSIQVHALKDA